MGFDLQVERLGRGCKCKFKPPSPQAFSPQDGNRTSNQVSGERDDSHAEPICLSPLVEYCKDGPRSDAGSIMMNLISVLDGRQLKGK